MNIILSTLNAKYIHTNLALRCLKAYTEKDFPMEISEYTIKDPEMNIVADLYSKKPDILGFSCYIWNIEETINVINMFKKISPKTKIIVGGPEVSYDVPYWLERLVNVDFIVFGEGEESFKQLLHSLVLNAPLKDVNGIAYNDDTKPVVHPQTNKIDLKTLPSPFRFEEDRQNLSKRIVYIETSRGCPFRCQFCLSSIEVGVRYFDREAVKTEIRYLMDNGAKVIKFVDRTFNISRSYAMEMFGFLINEHKPGTVFQFEITADIMRPEVIQYLNDNAPVGLFRFEIGVQSTNDETNELVMRKQNYEKLKRTVTMVKDGGKIDQHLDLIAGLPEEDYLSFRKTFNDVFAMGPEELQLGFLKMLRGTGLRINAKNHDYVYMDNAPYEILRNNVLSFDDIIRIKQVEDVLEKYWNDHRMDHTITYLVTNVYDTPFDFFQSFGSYWDEQGWSRIGHQLEDLFLRLLEFLTNTKVAQVEVIEALMKKDYLLNRRYKPRKPWWQKPIVEKEKKEIYQLLLSNPSVAGKQFAALELKQKELYKHTVLEQGYVLTDNGQVKREFIIAYYNPKDGSPTLFEFTA